MSDKKKTKLSNEMLGMSSDEDNNTRMQSKKSKKKKKPKAQSRPKTSPSFDSESDLSSKARRKVEMSQIGGNIDEENAIEHDDDMNEHINNKNARTRKKKDFDEEQTAPHSGSNMGGSMVSSKKYKGRVRNNRQPSVHSESRYDNGYIEYDHDDYMSEMGNNDPFDEYGQDGDMSEEDEEEPRFKYSTADLADGGVRNQKCCLLSAGVFFILIAIAVSVLMVKLPNKNDGRLLSLRQHVRGANLSFPL